MLSNHATLNENFYREKDNGSHYLFLKNGNVVLCVFSYELPVLCLFLLDFVLVYEEFNDEPPTKEVLRFRNRYMKNLQKSQLEFEEVGLFSCLNVLLKIPRLKICDRSLVRKDIWEDKMASVWFLKV